MKYLTTFLTIVVILVTSNFGQEKNLGDYIKEAEDYQQTGELGQATKLLEEAVKVYPDSAVSFAYLGLYIGMQAGQTSDFMEAGKLVGTSFEMLNKAVSLDSVNPVARLHRGILGISVPEFLGKLDVGIQDLETLISISEASPVKVPKDMIVSAYDRLGQGYNKKGEKEKAKLAWEKIIELAPESRMAQNAKESINKIQRTKRPKAIEKKSDPAQVTKLKQKLKNEPENFDILLELGKAYISDNNVDEAANILKKAIAIDSSKVEAYKLLVFSLGEIASRGYDEKIYENTDLRTNLAFEITRLLDRAYKLDPNDIELKLQRATVGVMMPFFVGRLENAIEELNTIINDDHSDSITSEAMYWLGAAYQKKSMSYWINVVSKYSNSNAAQTVFASMRPDVKHFDLSKYEIPIVAIDFIIGFRDELEPQTAIWIEDQNGKFIKTIYVSGFSGYAKESQANLTDWAEASKFADADAVTGASINVGHHIYVWDIKDLSGAKVKDGEYQIKVEVAFWPSLEYQLVSTKIKVGKSGHRGVTEEGNLIPYLEVKYYPKS